MYRQHLQTANQLRQHDHMKIVFASLPAYGHLYPLMPLALACADAGHEVTVATGAPFVGQLPLPTFRSVPPHVNIDDLVAETKRRHPEATGEDLVVGMFADVSAEAVSGILLPELERNRPDLVVYEAMNTGAGVAANVLGIPAVAFAISIMHLGYAAIHPATVRFQQRAWTDRDLTPPLGAPLLAEALLDPSPPSLRPLSGPYEVAKIPIRGVAWTGSAGTVPDWLLAARTRPRVYLTLGTVAFGAVEVLRRAIDDLLDLDLDLLVAVGPDGDPAALGQTSPRVRLERFVDQARVLRLIDVVVHHGGTGTVLGAFEAGVPQLILPQGADQFFNADALPRIGAARALHNDDQAPGTIRAAVEALLADGPERQMTRRIQSEIAAMPSPAVVADELVRYGSEAASRA